MHQKRPLRAPAENGGLLCEPSFEVAVDRVAENVQARREYEALDLQGRSLGQLSRHAREELLRDALQWTTAYRDVDPLSPQAADRIFLAGHQPQMFHPGVWLKNFALGRLAERCNAVAVNLIIDSDAVKAAALRVPSGTPDRPELTTLAFDSPGPSLPYEERRVADRSLFCGFGQRVRQQMASLMPHPLIESYWPLVHGRYRQTDNLGACLAQARHQLEGHWGLNTLEIPQSRVCDGEAFLWFVAHLLVELPRLHGAYNEAVDEYRRSHRIRNAAQPVPNLDSQHDWLEAPLWVWSAEQPERRRLFVCRNGNRLTLSDRVGWQAKLSLSAGGTAQRVVEQLVALQQGSVRIRSRALITTLWARLALGDLFIHGIGGAKYDHVTDRIIKRFFGLKPPHIQVLSGTLHLAVERPSVVEDDERAIRQQLREMTFHPEAFLAESNIEQLPVPEGSTAPADLVTEKRRWIEKPQTRENARQRCRAIRGANDALQPWVQPQRERLQSLLTQTEEALRVRQILASREYAFCLHPEETLRPFLTQFDD